MLTKTKIQKLRPSDRVYRVSDGDRLYIEVKPNGRKLWRYRYQKADGKMSMVSLGEFPQTSLEAARKARDARKSQGRYHTRTFEEIALEWHSRKLYRSDKNRDVEWGRVRNYLLPTLGSMRIAQIEPVHIMPILELIEEKGYLELARRVRSIASQIFRYGVSKVACSHDPADVLRGSTKAPIVTPMPAITDEDDFADLLRRINASTHLMPSVKLALQLAPYLVLRSGEIRQLRPEHIDHSRRVIVVPAELMKRSRDHLVPYGDQVERLLRKALNVSDGSYLLSGVRRGRAISPNTLNIALSSLGLSQTPVFHGFRSSFATLGRESLRFPGELIERQLAHSDRNQVRAAYDRSYRLEERREMMIAWAEYLERIVA